MHHQINTRAMAVKKIGHQSDRVSKGSSPNSGKSDAEHEIEKECSLDPAKIVEVHRRIGSREYTVNSRRVADKLFELESRLRILDGPGPND